ncbi:lytic transglycosylase, partial [Serratia sp. Se-RSmG]|nr:lytic transglycosylase [Serratia sp. Se-RSmG]
MKAKAIFLASVLLVGCQSSRQDAPAPEQHAQSLSSAGQDGEAGEYTANGRASSARWLDNNSPAAQQDLWNFISDELKMEVPENSR